VVKNLVENGRDDFILTMATKEDYPSWGNMLRRGATTLWESWEGDISLLHSSYLHLGLWFIEGLGGIRPDPKQGGFQSFVIRPAIPQARKADLQWVRAGYESLYGPIASRWSVEGKKFRVCVTIPPNSTATLLLPAKDAASIRESGRPVSESPGVKPSGMQDGRVVLQLQSGVYDFQAEQ
jgi:alpha-L-rhamnosidase